MVAKQNEENGNEIRKANGRKSQLGSFLYREVNIYIIKAILKGRNLEQEIQKGIYYVVGKQASRI